MKGKRIDRHHHGEPLRQKVVVVHRGARDAYGVAAALAKAGSLEKLVTDLYWPGDKTAPGAFAKLLPASVRSQLSARFHPHVPSRLVQQLPWTGLRSFAYEKIKRISQTARREAIRATDLALGTAAGQLARRENAQLLSYSYYGCPAFQAYGKPGVLFQLHPHPSSVRRILERELADHPECETSLRKEWELSLSLADFERLITETKLASHFLVASSFTKRTLLENGADPATVQVIPYGVDAERFSPLTTRRSTEGPLRLLFVGTINQRKGIKYLLEALRLVRSRNVLLTVCGRVVDDLSLFDGFSEQVTVRPSVSATELERAYQDADLFVFPSVAEGFAQVLLESLASGLPILSTTHTAAPDLIEEGVHGFVVEPRRPDLLAERIEWALSHRRELIDMRVAARRCAEQFTWARFERGVVEALRRIQESTPAVTADRIKESPAVQCV